MTNLKLEQENYFSPSMVVEAKLNPGGLVFYTVFNAGTVEVTKLLFVSSLQYLGTIWFHIRFHFYILYKSNKHIEIAQFRWLIKSPPNCQNV